VKDISAQDLRVETYLSDLLFRCSAHDLLHQET
jgi:hypothetical protein